MQNTGHLFFCMVAERQLLKCPEHSVKTSHHLNHTWQQTLTVINICKQL